MSLVLSVIIINKERRKGIEKRVVFDMITNTLLPGRKLGSMECFNETALRHIVNCFVLLASIP